MYSWFHKGWGLSSSKFKGLKQVYNKNTSKMESFHIVKNLVKSRQRCILLGLRNITERSRTEAKQLVVKEQAGDAYQLSRVMGSTSGDSDICQGKEHEYTSEKGHCLYQDIHKPR